MFALSTALTCFAGVSAQQVVWRVEGIPDQTTVGGWIDFVGDIDQDGYADVGATCMLTPSAPYMSVQIRSGRDGDVIRELAATVAGRYWTGYTGSREAGDWDGDGRDDYCVNLVTGQRALRDPVVSQVRSGVDDRVLWQLRAIDQIGPILVMGGLDGDGDGRPEVVLQYVDDRDVQRRWLYVIESPGVLRYTLQVTSRYPYRMGNIGDVDADGGDDFAYWNYDPFIVGQTLDVHSGRTGQLLYQVVGTRQHDYLGSGDIEGLGDIDADGHDDFAVSTEGIVGNAVIEVISGRTGQRIHTFRGGRYQPNKANGASLGGGFDIDQDGINDLVSSDRSYSLVPPATGTGRCAVYSLRTGQKIAEIERPAPSSTSNTHFAWEVELGPAQPGNPFPVIALLEPAYGQNPTGYPGRPGRLWMWRLLPRDAQVLGGPCPGTLGDAPRIGIAELDAARTRLHLSNVPPNALGILMIGASSTVWGGTPLPLRLDRVGLVGCELLVSVDATVTVRAGTRGIDSGYAYVDVPSAAGLFAQWLVLDPGRTGRAALSAALHW